MKHFTAIAFATALLAVPANGQTPAQAAGAASCSARFAQALSIRGIHLGLSADELLAMFPDSDSIGDTKRALDRAKEPPNFGIARIHLLQGGNVSKEKLTGINNISLTLFDDRVVHYWVTYEGPPSGVYWDNIDDWIAKLSETLRLPGASAWVRTNDTANLNCEGVQISVSAGGSASLKVETKDWLTQINARQKAYQEKKRRDFKP